MDSQIYTLLASAEREKSIYTFLVTISKEILLANIKLLFLIRRRVCLSSFRNTRSEHVNGQG